MASSKHLVDPELAPLLDMLPTLQINAETLQAARDFMVEVSRATPMPDVPVQVSTKTIPGPKGAPAVPVQIFIPKKGAAKKPGYLHIHGGGYVGGTPDMGGARNRVLANELGCVIVSVDYRLAPENPHPAPVEDCYAGLKWLYDNAGELGIDTKRIAIGGESAGGGLTAALGLLARDRGEVPVAFQYLLYPMLDDRTSSVGERHPYAGEFTWTNEANVFGWTSLLGQKPGGKDVPYYAAPARAPSLKGLPPTFIAVGALDLFIDENIEYARRLIQDGVPTELHVYPGAFHGFDMAADTTVAKTFAGDALEAFRRAFAR